ncbi:hypothetical protein PQX77_017398, partial [Marasmius sp. AFHP31]
DLTLSQIRHLKDKDDVPLLNGKLKLRMDGGDLNGWLFLLLMGYVNESRCKDGECFGDEDTIATGFGSARTLVIAGTFSGLIRSFHVGIPRESSYPPLYPALPFRLVVVDILCLLSAPTI